MKKTVFILIFSVIVTALWAQDPRITIKQGNREFTVSPGATAEIKIKAKEFILEFPSESYLPEDGNFYAVKISASYHESLLYAIENGMSEYDIVPFSPGTGMATTGPYPSLYLEDEAHHYIVFNPDDPNLQRADLVSLNGKNLILSWTIDSVVQDGETLPLKQLKGETLYLLFYIPQNNDKTVQQNEWIKMKLKLK